MTDPVAMPHQDFVKIGGPAPAQSPIGRSMEPVHGLGLCGFFRSW
jgi:hypothetical protein